MYYVILTAMEISANPRSVIMPYKTGVTSRGPSARIVKNHFLQSSSDKPTRNEYPLINPSYRRNRGHVFGRIFGQRLSTADEKQGLWKTLRFIQVN